MKHIVDNHNIDRAMTTFYNALSFQTLPIPSPSYPKPPVMSTPRTRLPRPRRGMVPPATYGKPFTVAEANDLQKTIRDLEKMVNAKAETKPALSMQSPKGPEPKSTSKNPSLPKAALVIPKLEYPPIASLRTPGSSSSATLTEQQPSTSTKPHTSWPIPPLGPPILRSPLVKLEKARAPPNDDYFVCMDGGEARSLQYNTVSLARATFSQPPDLLPSGESRRKWLASEPGMDKSGMCWQYGVCGACLKQVYPLDTHTPMHFDYIDEWMDHRRMCWRLLARMDIEMKWKPENGEEEFESFC